MSIGMAARRQVSAGINVGQLIDHAIREAGLTHKEAIALMHTDAGSWSRALRGQYPLDLWTLRFLPVKFWQVFLSAFAAALIRSWMDDLQAQPSTMAKADLQQQERKAS
jgi:hypothetical protein